MPRKKTTWKRATVGEMARVAALLLGFKGEYRHDPEHKHQPEGGGWTKTEKGWSRGEKKEAPVKVEKPVEKAPEKQEQKPQQEPQKEGPPKSNYFDEKEMSLPKDAKQPVKTQEELFTQAKEAHKQMVGWLDSDGELQKALGMAHNPIKPGEEFDIEKALDVPGPVLITAPLKGEKRAKEKVDADYKGDWSQLTDVVRASIAVDSFDEIDNVVKTLKKHGIKLAKRPKDRFTQPTSAGYRDILLNIELPNGHVGELQLHTKPILKTKEKEHKKYEVVRTIDADAKKAGRTEYTPEEKATIAELEKQSRAAYDQAWAESNKKKGSRMAAADKYKSILFPDKTTYYEYKDLPVRISPNKRPVMIKDGKQKTIYSTFSFLHNCHEISLAQFGKMVDEQDKDKE